MNDEKVGYVCQMISQPENITNYDLGAELPSGMVRNSVFKEVGGFNVNGYNYFDVVLDQSLFLKNIIDHGYKTVDTIKEYKAFYDRTKTVTLYGNPKDKEIFRPIECVIHDCNQYINKTDDEKITYILDCNLYKDYNLEQ
jgi:hypothetical protein